MKTSVNADLELARKYVEAYTGVKNAKLFTRSSGKIAFDLPDTKFSILTKQLKISLNSDPYKSSVYGKLTYGFLITGGRFNNFTTRQVQVHKFRGVRGCVIELIDSDILSKVI